MSILVGGLSELYQGDLDLGRRVVERLAAEPPGPDVIVEDLYYGAVAVAQRLRDLAPEVLVLVGAVQHGDPPGTVRRVRVVDHTPDAATVAGAIADAVTGYVDIALTLDVAAGLEALPARTLVVEVEPASVTPAAELSAAVTAAVDTVIALVHLEVARIPVLQLADRVRDRLADGHVEITPALAAMQELLDALDGLDRAGTWGRSFAARDRLRLEIAGGRTGEGMDHLDWSLWWTLIEAVDRLQASETIVDAPTVSASQPAAPPRPTRR